MEGDDNNSANAVNIQMQIGGQLPAGFVAVVIHNCPLLEIEEGGALVPAMKLTAEHAKEVGMNLIYLAKLSECIQK